MFRDTIFIKRNLGLTNLWVYIVASLLMYHLLVQVMYMYNKIKQQIKETEEDLFFGRKNSPILSVVTKSVWTQIRLLFDEPSDLASRL